MKCSKCGGAKVYSGGCNGEWECWGDCDKEKLILPPDDLELRNNLKVEKSVIDGMGLFAGRNFKSYEVIWFEGLKKANPESGGPLRWANHSDNPNAALVISHSGLFEVSLVAIQGIKKGQEVTYDYGVFGHSGHRATCKCGGPDCKGFFTLRTEWGEKK